MYRVYARLTPLTQGFLSYFRLNNVTEQEYVSGTAENPLFVNIPTKAVHITCGITHAHSSRNATVFTGYSISPHGDLV